MNDARQSVLIDMAYEIGGAGLAGFAKLLAAARAGMWATAAVELRNSKLFTQAAGREQRNMNILATGEFPPGVTCGEDLTKRNEGCVLTAKPDANGKWEIGYGRDIDAPHPGSQPPTCTQDDAEAFFAADYPLATQRAEDDLGSEYW